MLRHMLKTSLLLFVFMLSTPFAAVHAETINGGWLADNGDMLFMAKSTKGTVVAMDVTADKQLRYVLTGTMVGNQLALVSRDGAAALTATVTESSLSGEITVSDQTGQAINATLYFAYNGGSYDGMWKHDAAEDYLLYATFKLKGVVTTIVPYFSISEADETIAYNLFLGAPASTDSKGNMSFSGISMLDYSVLKLGFTSTTAANATMLNGNQVTKFTLTKIYAVTKKSGEF